MHGRLQLDAIGLRKWRRVADWLSSLAAIGRSGAPAALAAHAAALSPIGCMGSWRRRRSGSQANQRWHNAARSG